MRFVFITISIFFLTLSSCYEPYSTSTDTAGEILVVDGLVTNEAATYHIYLSYATPFYSDEKKVPVASARVYITDEKTNVYTFKEREAGHYISDSLKFTGHSGSTYFLNIGAPDGNIYRSEPQLLRPAYIPDKVYAMPGIRESLSTFTGQVEQTEGAIILADLKSTQEASPGFRFNTEQVKQYFYTRNIPPPDIDPPLYFFYCWQTENSEQYFTLAGRGQSPGTLYFIYKKDIQFVYDRFRFFAPAYSIGPQQSDLSYIGIRTSERQEYTIMRRLVYVNLYTLNNDSYLYYKRMDDQLRAEGKIFDPVAVQIYGNISCVTDPGKKAIGFFEASSVSRTRYQISYKNNEDQYLVTKLPYIRPPEPDGCRIDKPPSFWVK